MRLGLGNNLVKTAFPIGTSPSLDLAFALDRSFTTDPAAAGNALITSRRGPAAKFSRGMGATQVNAAGLIEYAPENLILRSEGMPTLWNPVDSSISPDVEVSPSGLTNADKLVENSLPASHRIEQTFTPISSTVYTASIFVKPAERNFILLGFTGGSMATTYVAANLSAETVSTAIGTPIASSITKHANGWYRVSITLASTGVTSSFFDVRISTDGVWANRSYLGDGTSGIFLWGAQLERASTARTYYPTTTAAFYGPRFDYDPATGASKGLLIEEQRTNLAERSETLNDAYWSKFQSTIDPDTGVAPDGRISADSLKDTAVTDAHSVYKSFTTTVNTNYVWSIFVKADTKSWVSIYVSINNVVYRGYFDLTNGVFGQKTAGVTFTSQAYGNGWYRLHAALSSGAFTTVVVALELANGDGLVSYSGDGTGKVFIWGAQFEVGVAATSATFPLSYIPTTSGTAARSADVCSIEGTAFSSFYNQPEGSVIINGDSWNGTTPAWCSFNVGPAGTGRTFEFVRSGSNLIHSDAFSGNTVVKSSPTFPNKFGFVRGQANGFSSFGGVAGGSTSTAQLSSPNRLQIGLGVSPSVGYLNGCIKSLTYYRKQLSTIKLQTLTTP